MMSKPNSENTCRDLDRKTRWSQGHHAHINAKMSKKYSVHLLFVWLSTEFHQVMLTGYVIPQYGNVQLLLSDGSLCSLWCLNKKWSFHWRGHFQVSERSILRNVTVWPNQVLGVCKYYFLFTVKPAGFSTYFVVLTRKVYLDVKQFK